MRNFESRIERLERSVGRVLAYRLEIRLHTGEVLCVIEIHQPGIDREPYSLM